MRRLLLAALLLAATNVVAEEKIGVPVIDSDGTLVLQHGSVDFAQLDVAQPGEFRGWVRIYVNGEPMLMPVFSVKANPPQGMASQLVPRTTVCPPGFPTEGMASHVCARP